MSSVSQGIVVLSARDDPIAGVSVWYPWRATFISKAPSFYLALIAASRKSNEASALESVVKIATQVRRDIVR
eukprot:4211165-Amphidinium_carterae.1